MPKVADNQLKGNYGAAVVMARLSAAECLVRPVAADTDVGIDLYCETIDQRNSSLDQKEPFLHFWIQVKAGKQCRVNPADKTASCCFDCSHLKYWARQPIPVFAALVPTEWPPSDEPHVYIVDVTTQFIMGHLITGHPRSSQTLRSDHYWPSGSKEAVSEFLVQVVPDSTARLQCSRGVVAASPTLTPQYEHSIPPVPVTRFRKKILTQLRTTAAFSILFSSSSGERTLEDREFRRKLACVVGQFKDDEHWESFMALGWSSHADQKYSSAVKFYRRAKSIIQRDRKVCDKPEWQEQIHRIDRLKRLAQNHRSPDEPV